MKQSKCIYAEALYYAFVYVALVFTGFLIGVIGLTFGWKADIVGFFTVVVPTIPFQPLLEKLNLVHETTLGTWPSNEGLMLAHGIWFLFFYFSYLAFLFYHKKKK